MAAKLRKYVHGMNVRRPVSEDMPAGVGARNDYSALGRELLAKLGVKASSGKHESINAIWKGDNGGTIFVGNQSAARGPADVLSAKGITHVVNW